MSRSVVAAVLVAACVLAGAGCKQVVKPNKNTEWAPDVRLATVPPPKAAPRQTATSPDRRRTATVVPTPNSADREIEHVYLDAGGRTYVVLGLPYEGQPIDNLHWQDSGTLVFERWYTEHQGIRFLIDCYKGVLGRAEPIRRGGK